MTNFEILTIIVSILAPILTALFWVVSRMDKKFEKMDIKFDEVRKDLHSVSERLGCLEVRVEERTLKVVHVEKKANE